MKNIREAAINTKREDAEDDYPPFKFVILKYESTYYNIDRSPEIEIPEQMEIITLKALWNRVKEANRYDLLERFQDTRVGGTLEFKGEEPRAYYYGIRIE